MKEQKKTIFILVPPLSGHINPISSLVYELCARDYRVIFFGNDENRSVIEKTGAEFRQYVNRNFANIEYRDVHEEDRDMMFLFINSLMNDSYELVPSFLRECELERPDLIVYDQTFLPAKYFVEVLKRNKRIKHRPPCIMFLPSLAFNEHTYKIFDKLVKKTFWSNFLILWLFVKQMVFNIYFGLRILHPIQIFMAVSDQLNIGAVFPELQPALDTFENKINFVGPCITEKVRHYDVKDAKLNEILESFTPRDQKPNDTSLNGPKLVYVSLGTLFNDNIRVFETIIRSFERLKSQQLTVIISTGEKCYQKFQHKIKHEGLRLPDNLFIYSQVPQIEILKRASLFLTHAGQNSASEAIHYNVPVICIPISADQPMVAYRLCDELKLGIRFDPLKLNEDELVNAIVDVLTNQSFSRRMSEMSQTSRKYNGASSAIKLVVDFLNKNCSLDNNNNETKKIN